jgi:AraC-like DNA-binding protein
MAVASQPAPELRGRVSRYHGFVEATGEPLRRREGPGVDVVVVLSFAHEWVVDDASLTSFVGGLHDRQVTTEHAGRSYGIQIDLAPPAARALFRIPMHELAQRTVPLEDVLPDRTLVERLADAPDWPGRFRLLDAVLARRFAEAEPAPREIEWAWRRLHETHGRLAIAALAQELGWSRKRIVARFREQVGLPPKTVARVMRFERARQLAAASTRPDWARIAAECGYYDQSHLTRDFRAVTGRPPATFFQDAVSAAA